MRPAHRPFPFFLPHQPTRLTHTYTPNTPKTKTNPEIQLREKYGKAKYVPLDLRFKKTRAIRRRLTKHEVRGVRHP